MSERPSPAELDSILPIKRVRAALKEMCNGVSRTDLAVVRERAAAVLYHIPDVKEREEAVDGVIQTEWKQLFSTRFNSEEKRDIRGRYYQARQLYLTLNNKDGGDFHGNGYLTNDGKFDQLLKKLRRDFGEVMPFRDYLDMLNERFDLIVASLGENCVGQLFLLHDSNGGVEPVTISAVTEMGALKLKEKKGEYRFEQLRPVEKGDVSK